MHPHRLSPFFAAIFFAVVAPALFAQAPADDGGTLFFPPALTVEAHSQETEVSHHFISYWKAPDIIVRRRVRQSLLSLLPVVFFDRPGGTQIPERYRQFAGSFDAADYADTLPVLGGDAFNKYYQILDIVGYRMNMRSEASLTLLGGYTAEPQETPEVAAQRAEAIRDYLVRVWRIDPVRIELLPPERLCGPEAPLPAREEARCVRIGSTDNAIIAPMKTTAITHSPLECYLDLHIDPYVDGKEIEAIEIDLMLDDVPAATGTIREVTASRSRSFRACMQVPQHMFNTGPKVLTAVARIRLKTGLTRVSNRVDLPIDYRTITEDDPRTISPLPFFHYRQTELDESQKFFLDSLLRRYPAATYHYGLSGGAEESEGNDGEEWLRYRGEQEEATRKGKESAAVQFYLGPYDRETEERPNKGPVCVFEPAGRQTVIAELPFDRFAFPDELKDQRYRAVTEHLHNRSDGTGRDNVRRDLLYRPPRFMPDNLPESRYYNRMVVVQTIRRPTTTQEGELVR